MKETGMKETIDFCLLNCYTVFNSKNDWRENILSQIR